MSINNLNNSIITIFEAKTRLIDTKVKVQGIVTYAKDKVFIQDSTSGINLYKQSGGDDFCEGDLIQVTGKINKSKDLIRIKRYKVKKISSQNTSPIPVDITIQDIVDMEKNKYESMLIRLHNVKIENINPTLPLQIIDSKNKKLYIYTNSDLCNINSGDWVDITGIFNSVNNKYELYIKTSQDIVRIHPPILFKYVPGNMTSTFDKTPRISAFLKKGSAFLNLSSAKLYIDSKEVLPVISENSISCIPTKNLSYGEHCIKISIHDLNGNIYEFQWYFIVENQYTNYNFYYGVPHCHTSYSDGKGTPTEAYIHAKNSKLDFLIITDHSGSLIRSEVNNPIPNWKMAKAEAETINKKYNDFLALIGFEMSTKIWGHVNVINCKNVIDKKTRKNPQKLYNWLCNEDRNNIILSINHPNRSSCFLSYISEFDKFINLIEVGNGSPPRQYRRLEKYYFKALDNGWHVGAVNGQDNHNNNWGEPDNLTVVIAENLDMKSFINALKLRRVYSTETRTLKLTVKANNHWMGSILDFKKSDKLNLQIIAEDQSTPITKIQLISNGGNTIKEKSFLNSNTAKWEPTLTITTDYSWYVVKVIHQDGRLGISSPIFVQTS